MNFLNSCTTKEHKLLGMIIELPLEIIFIENTVVNDTSHIFLYPFLPLRSMIMTDQNLNPIALHRIQSIIDIK